MTIIFHLSYCMTTSYFLPIRDSKIFHARTKGVSGSETAALIVMEQIALRMPREQCFLFCGNGTRQSDRISNLTFTDNFELLGNTTTLIMSSQFLLNTNLFSTMNNLQHVVLVSHTLPVSHIVQYLKNIKWEKNNIILSVVYLSHWTKEYIQHNFPDIISCFDKTVVIGNPLISDLYTRPLVTAIPWSFVFFATWERGGEVALATFKKIRVVEPSATFHIASYYPNLPPESCQEGIYVYDSLGKAQLCELLSKSAYFIYPLNLPNGHIHKDTFACCVAEAIAQGVRVVTYSQGSLFELYNGLIDFIPIEYPNIKDCIENYNFMAFEPWLTSDDATSNIANYVLNEMTSMSEDERWRRAQKVRNIYGSDVLGQKWYDFINDNVSETTIMNSSINSTRTKVIMTCFAGRQANLAILFAYVDKLVKMKLVDEFHIWDFTRNPLDTEWLKKNVSHQKHPSFSLKHVVNKGSWQEYYTFYTEAAFPDSIIIKCDDDIVFIDVDAFSGFIKHRIQDKDTLLLFPSTINNGVCAHYQQNAGLIGDDFGDVFPYDTFCGKLWSSGTICSKLHYYFMDKISRWIKQTASLGVVKHTIGDRISINMFAIRSCDLKIFDLLSSPRPDDEHELTVVIPKSLHRFHSVYMPLTVVHLAFYQQRTTGLDESAVLQKYMALSKTRLGHIL